MRLAPDDIVPHRSGGGIIDLSPLDHEIIIAARRAMMLW